MAFVDLKFTITGTQLPVDHGYQLFAAISKKIPTIHETPVAIHPINGILLGNRQLELNQNSHLTFRLDHTQINLLLPLAGKTLMIDNHKMNVGIPQISLLTPHDTCRSRLVIIKGFLEAESFLLAVKRQLFEREIEAEASLIKRTRITPDCDPYIRRTMSIKGAEIVGYAIEVSKLSPEDSLKLQEKGIGGKQHMGCGIFKPSKKRNVS